MNANQLKNYSRATRYRRICGASAALCATLILCACGGGSGSTASDNNPGNPSGPTGPAGPTGNTVSAAAQSANVVGVVGKQPGTAVTVNFMTTTGTATNLTIDTSLPAGWAAASANVCASVANTNGCTTTLTYAPTTATSAAQTLTLTYHYTDNQGQAQSGTTTLSYAARQAFLYVAQFTNSPVNGNPSGGTFAAGSIQRCVTNSDGSLDSCSDSGATGVQAPVRIVFSGNDAYVSQVSDVSALVGGGAGGAVTGSVLHCTADPTTGALSGCADSGVTGLIFPIGLAAQGTDLYVLDTSASSPGQALQRCQIGSNGALANCAAVTPAGGSLLGAASLAINNGSLYFVGSGSDAALRCPINTDGSIGACSITPANGTSVGTGAADIKFNGTSAYLAGSSGELVQCPANGDGTLGSCTETALPASGTGGTPVPFGVGFVGHVAYIGSLLATGTGLTQCALNDDGTVGTCTVPATPALNAPFGLATY
jgi:hypothetical protein